MMVVALLGVGVGPIQTIAGWEKLLRHRLLLVAVQVRFGRTSREGTKPAVRPPSLAVECTMAVPSLASIVAAAAWMAAAGSAACVMQLAEG